MTLPADIEIRPMRAEDFPRMAALWKASAGVRESLGDTPEGIAMYLARNPGMSLVAEDGGQIVATVLCGHDGRRGFIHHMAVAATHRRYGVGRAMVGRCIAALADAGIPKCHLFVAPDNQAGKAFWRSLGWQLRTDLEDMSIETGG
ncbi:GNAT family N-acetyltransferase [Desertibaculum subflavum]|uniref:GNAT family N-acetyltransferase n=1 Tax=Desertibaculum subflavum TaxID=2268458 RepID=UPI0034D38897